MISNIAERLHLERPLVCLDLETTGIFPARDRIVQIGIVKFYPNGEVTEWQSLINPGMAIDPEASAVHKIDDAAVEHAPTFADLAPIIAGGLEDCDLLGYNLKVFDIPFLQAEFARCSFTFKEPRVIDVFKLYQRVSPRNLTAAVKEFLGETFEAAHDALADVRMTARVLEAMLTQHPEIPTNVQGIHDLLFKPVNGLDADRKFAWKGAECVLNFGKWAGFSIRDPQVRGYLDWIASKGNFAEDTKSIARLALAGQYPRKV